MTSQLVIFRAFFIFFQSFFIISQKNSKPSKVIFKYFNNFLKNLDRTITFNSALSKIHRQNLKKILLFSTKQIIFTVGGKNIKIILEIKFYFISTLPKITKGGFVNQLLKILA